MGVNVLDPNPTAGRQRKAVIARAGWANAAVWTSTPDAEAGTTLDDLTTDQPQDFVGFDITGGAGPLVLTGQADQDLDVVSVILASATVAATIAIGVGDSIAEADGTGAADVSGSGHHGTLEGAAFFTTGKYQGGVSLTHDTLDPLGDHVATPGVDAIAFGTYALWVKPAAVGDIVLLHHGVLELRTDSDGYLVVPCGSGVVASKPLIAGVWQRVSITADGAGTITIGLDGEDVASATGLTFGAPISTSILWGTHLDTGPGMTGLIDDLRYYFEVLSAADVLGDSQSEETTHGLTLRVQHKLNGYQSGTLPFGMPPNLPAEPGQDQRRSSFHLLPYRMSAQCVRITIADPTNPEPFRLGRLFLGQGDQPGPEHNYSENYQLPSVDDTKQTRTPTSQTMIDPHPQVRGLEFTFEHVPRLEAVLVWLHQYQWLVGTSEPILVCLDPEADDSMDAFFCYGPLRELGSPPMPAYYNGWRIHWAVGRFL